MIAVFIGLAVLAVGLGGLAVYLLGQESTRAQGIGQSLLTGAVISVAFYGVQLYIQDRREDQDKREQFRLTVGFSQHLEGLAPRYSLAGLPLPGKALDRARLAGQDLKKTNFEEASLKAADLRHADLRKAILYRANLSEALLAGARLDNADLRFARLTDATIYGPGETAPTLELSGARVNQRTCWPEDFLSSPQAGFLRRQLHPEPVFIRGEQLAEPDIGHACVVRFDNVFDAVKYLKGRRGTVEQVARVFRVSPSRVLKAMQGPGGAKTFGRNLPRVARPCVGVHRVDVRLGVWEKGVSLVVAEKRGSPPEAAELVALRTPQEQNGQKPPKLNLPPGGTLALEGATGSKPEYRLERQARPC
jgi:hypothetical protein